MLSLAWLWRLLWSWWEAVNWRSAIALDADLAHWFGH